MAARREGSLPQAGSLLVLRAITVAVTVTVTIAVAITTAGCRGNPKPVARVEQTPPAIASPVTPATTQPASTPIPAVPAVPPAATAKDPARGDAPVVVDPGVDDSKAPRTLVEAAQAERERRAKAGTPGIVITNKNLHQYAAKGQLTVMDPKQKEKKKKGVAAAKSATSAASEEDSADQPVRDEQYWRSHSLEIRLRWRASADEVKKLEQKSTELRQRFYSENDSFVRDNRVKPEWDRVTDRLRQARAEGETAKQELAAFLEEGRRAAALPGWLREGEEQEPPAEPVKKKAAMPALQSIEPPVLNEGGPPGWR